MSSSRVKKQSEVKSTSLSSETTPRWEIDGKDGTHRIVCGEIVGQWATYQQVAALKVGASVYYAATDYFHGDLPTEVVFQTRIVK